MFNQNKRVLGKIQVYVKPSAQSNILASFDKENIVNQAQEKREVRILQNPQSVFPYKQEIYEFLTKRERTNEFQISDYQINEQMRQTTIMCIKRICFSYNQRAQTFFQAVDLLDQVIQLTNPMSAELDIIALTCYFIASKYEEIYPPPLSCLVQGKPKDGPRVIQKEKEILQLLDFNVISDTTIVWINFFLELLNPQLKRQDVVEKCLNYAEKTLYYTQFLNFKKSEIALCVLAAVEIQAGSSLAGQLQWDRLTLHKKPDANSKPLKFLSVVIGQKYSK